MPKISVAMATYNGARYIREQIDSVLCQTFQNFELIICDDCSTDDTLSILYEYSTSDVRVKVIPGRCNLGFKDNFERAIKHCTGDYVALCDQDDIWLPDHIELLLQYMGGCTQIVCGKPIFVSGDNEILSDKYDYFLMFNPPKTPIGTARHILLGWSTYQGASMLIRRSFFQKALPIPEEACFHDSWFAILACFGGGLIYVDKPTMRYRRLESSVTYSTLRIKTLRRFFAYLIHNHTAKDRLCMINCIRNRLDTLSCEQKTFLNRMQRMLDREKTIWGRLINTPYKLFYFNEIFASDVKHLFS